MGKHEAKRLEEKSRQVRERIKVKKNKGAVFYRRDQTSVPNLTP